MELISQHPSHFITYNIGSTEELSVEPLLEAANEKPFHFKFIIADSVKNRMSIMHKIVTVD